MKITLITHLKLHNCLRSYHFGQILARMGHEVTHVSISYQSRLKTTITVQNGVTITETPDIFWGRARSGWDPWDVINRVFHLTSKQNDKMDIVHGFECRPVTIYPILALKKKYKDIIFISDWNDWWGRGGLISEKRPSWYKLIFGISENCSTALFDFLKEEGIPFEITDSKYEYGIYLENMVNFSEQNGEEVLDVINQSSTPLVRFWRWPAKTKSALSITGDIDTVTSIDYLMRLFGR